MYLLDGNEWNDKTDSKRFINSKENIKRYGLCFSYSRDESIAMWMLYGGLYDEGAMYSFTKNYINRIIEYCPTIHFGFFKGKTFNEEKTISKEKLKIYLKDILYYKKT